MAKLAAFLAALLLVAHASAAFGSTITTVDTDVVDDRPSRRGSEQCRQQVQQRDLSHCSRYLREEQQQEQRGGRRGGYDEGADAEELNGQADFQRCCNELRMIRDERCRCEGLRMELQQEQERGFMRPREMSQIMQSARRLLNMCRVGPTECDFEMSTY
ncbi:hypothetical protein L484_011891 [Morus notabilis]|uniref:Bifunctional inhibitor/plant lipid transfer protein/seed storage helical domain-containing protein n=1 Tax=Morus notabilis TaxID=981085 RepID=W9SGB8_9ROSA|nr:2S sulfur-rich seed storage protein 2 [Morus notabilis]EXC05102.1 hypothetical protein L484_011891 [Morus notabilis]